jgi:serpin B
MKKNIILAVFFLAFVIILQCSNNPGDSGRIDRELTIAEKELIESDNLFGLKLFRSLAKADKDFNIFISPLSISMALGMALNGAAGETRQEIQETLELSGMTIEDVNLSYQSLIEFLTNLDDAVKFEIANSIWCREGFQVKQEFYDLNRIYFGAEVAELDFNLPSAADIINNWVDSKTHGKITDIVESPIGPLMMMFLINAIYFKGDWTCQFDKDLTHDTDFSLADGSKVKVEMMALESDFHYYENDMFQEVDLPYGNGDFSMMVFLPRLNDISADASNLISQFTDENWNIWQDNLDSSTVNLYLPKFELEYEKKLKDILTDLGMGIAFVPFQADFSGIADVEDLHISSVIHKTYVKVDEEGTEAAAVTSVGIGNTSIPPESKLMIVNRPFVIVIKENKSGTLLFLGKVENPTL